MVEKLNTDKIVREIESKGFLVVENILSKHDISILTSKCKEIILDKNNYTNEPSKNVNGRTVYDTSRSIVTAYKTVTRNILGNSIEVDTILEIFFSNPGLKEILKIILGDDYKLYTCALRHATHDSKYVGLHQDADYQFTVSILLNDIDVKSPTTTFCEGSHLIPFNFGSKFEGLDTKYFNNILKPAIGSKGDTLFFFNKVLHGMKTSQNTKDDSTAILFCLQPSGYPCPRWALPDKSNYKTQFLDSLGPSLKRLMVIEDNSLEEIDNKSVLKRSDHAQTRIIDKIVNKNNHSFLEYIAALRWHIRYIYFFSFRVVRKIYKIIVR